MSSIFLLAQKKIAKSAEYRDAAVLKSVRCRTGKTSNLITDITLCIAMESFGFEKLSSACPGETFFDA